MGSLPDGPIRTFFFQSYKAFALTSIRLSQAFCSLALYFEGKASRYKPWQLYWTGRMVAPDRRIIIREFSEPKRNNCFCCPRD
jgi:hypothetical protein